MPFDAALQPSSPRAARKPLSPATAALCKRLARLPRSVRQTFVLSRLDGMSYTTIAKHLKCQESLVEKALIKVFGTCNAGLASSEFAQASQWYVHLQSTQATASQRIEFRHWLDAQPAHLQAFEDCEQLWRALREPAEQMGANGWHLRPVRSGYLPWLMLIVAVGALMTLLHAH